MMMKRKWILVAVCLLVGVNLLLPVSIAQEKTGQRNIRMENLSQKEATIPSVSDVANRAVRDSNVFTENRGQWDSSILFVGITSFGRVVFTNEAIWYEVQERKGNKTNEENTVNYHYLSLSFQNRTDHQLIIQGLSPVEYTSNYLLGNDPSHWGIGCKNYTSVVYKNIWDNIDMQYYFTPDGLKYEYHIHPGGDVNDIHMQVEGANVEVNSEVLEFVLPTSNNTLLLDDQLFLYTQTNHQEVAGSFVQHSNNSYGFQAESWNSKDTLVIDPIVYSTYLGGGDSFELVKSLAIDVEGCTYIVGSTKNANLPTKEIPGGRTVPGYDQDYHDGNMFLGDAYVLKLSPEGTKLKYATYLGGKDGDCADAIAIDSHGCAYITGSTQSTDFPMRETLGGRIATGYDHTYNGITTTDVFGNKTNMSDVFVVKLSPEGTKLEYATYLGGKNNDSANAIALDSKGCVYVAGSTQSKDFPMKETLGGTAASGYDQTSNGLTDGFIVKLSSDGERVEASSYIGGSENDYILSLQLSNDERLYATGSTRSTDFPTEETVGGRTAPGYDHKYNGGGEFSGGDVFVIKLNAKCNKLYFSTFLGGSDGDVAKDLAVDSAGNAYVTGFTHSRNFPVCSSFDRNSNGMSDAFVLKLNSEGTKLEYATYLGGNEIDWGNSIDVDNHNNAYVCGITQSQNFPVLVNSEMGSSMLDRSFNGMTDAFVAILDNKGNKLNYSTFIGGEYVDECFCINVGANNTFYIAGVTSSDDFPLCISNTNCQLPGYNQKKPWSHSGFTMKCSPKQEPSSPVLEYSLDKRYFHIYEDKNVFTYLTIKNIGGEDSVLSGSLDANVGWLGLDSDSFSIKGSKQIKVRIVIYNSLDNGDYTGEITINSNDPLYPQEKLFIKLSVDKTDYKKMKVTLEKSSFKLFAENSTKTTMKIVNEGGKDFELFCEVYAPEDWIKVPLASQTGFSLAQDASKEIDIIINSNGLKPGEYSGNICINSNSNFDSWSTGINLIVMQDEVLSVVLQIGNKTAYVQKSGSAQQKRVRLDVPPTIIQGRTMVPLRFLAETFGADVTWLQDKEEIQIRFKELLIHLWLSRKNGRTYDALIERKNEKSEKINLEAPPLSLNGRTVVPLRFIGETFGTKVQWDSTTQNITLVCLCDLVSTKYRVKSYSIVEGDQFWTDWFIKNIGMISSKPCVCSLYISLDGKYSSDDICVGEFDIPALSVDEEGIYRVEFLFPGFYSQREDYEAYVIIRIDVYDQLEEITKNYYISSKSINVIK